MSWFDVSAGRLRFRGRITTQPVLDWVASDEGTAAVQAAARQTRFALFGRTRLARRRICRELRDAIGARGVLDAVAAECDRYVGGWTDLAYAPSLPRVTIAMHRLVVVPRAMIPGRTGPGLMARIAACADLTRTGDAFRSFFSRWILSAMDGAVGRARPSPQNPVHARESWACVARDDDFIWVDPLWSGPEWRGHVVMFEMPAGRLGRRDRRELQAAIEQLTASLPNLTRQQRDGTVRAAAEQMKSLTLRAP